MVGRTLYKVQGWSRPFRRSTTSQPSGTSHPLYFLYVAPAVHESCTMTPVRDPKLGFSSFFLRDLSQETPRCTQMHPGGQETSRRHPGDTQETPRRHPEDIQEHPGDSQETPRRLPGDTHETPRRPRRHPGGTQSHPEALRRHPGGSESENLENYDFCILFVRNLTNGQTSCAYTQGF